MSLIDAHRHRLPWLAVFALACVVEWAAQKVKEWSGRRLLDPKPANAAAKGDDNGK